MGGWASDVNWSPDGKHLAISGGERRQRLGARREPLRPHDLRDDRAGRDVESSAFGSDTTRLLLAIEVAGTYDLRASRVEIVDWRTSTTIRSVPGEAWDIVVGPVDVFATSSNPRAAEQTVTIWNATDGQQQVQMVGHTGTIQGLAFSPDGATVATGGTTGSFDCGMPRPGRNC